MSWSPNHPDSVGALFERRKAPVLALAEDPRTVAEACHGMARRFHRGGKLVVFGNGGPSIDAQHVAVEFLVGKPATVRIVPSDMDGVTYLAVTLDDRQHAHGRYPYFSPDEIEPLEVAE